MPSSPSAPQVSSPSAGSTASSSPTPPNKPQIRHAGRAHVRGKIRRVWRPRYLELLDQGIVHYYEFPSSPATAATTSWNPTTTTTPVEDVSLVGGAWESFLAPSPSSTMTQTQPQQPQNQPWMIPKYTLAISHARILDVTTLRDMHVGLPRGTYGFTFRGQRVESSLETTHESPLEPRDFLCAVSTLEEAQMWVVALQWAASERMICESIQELEQQESPGEFVTITGGSACQSLNSSTHSATTPSETTTTTSQQQPPPKQPRSASAGGGKIVVTKVTAIRLVRVAPFQWEVAYEIHGLFLDRVTAESWIALRTADDFAHLLRQLHAELPAHNIMPFVDPWKKPLEELPRLRNYNEKHNLQTSIRVIQDMLRSLVTNGTMVQTTAMKSFLGLSSLPKKLQPLSRRWWTYHNGQALVERHVETLSVPTEVHVKTWLQEPAEKDDAWDTYAVTILQRPSYLWTGLGVSSVACLWPLCNWAWNIYGRLVPSFTVRADALVITWIGAAYLGYQYHVVTTTTTTRHNHSTTATAKTSAPRKVTDTDGEEEEDDDDDTDDESSEGEAAGIISGAATALANKNEGKLPSPLPQYPEHGGKSCWSQPVHDIFHVRSATYFQTKIKEPSGPAPLTCRGIDVWMTDNPERNIARHPAVLGGKLGDEDTFLVNFLLPFGNFVCYFNIPPLTKFPKKLRNVWTKFLKGDQQYRDARLKLLPVVAEGPWIVKAAVGPGKSPALLGKVIPLQYFFRDATRQSKAVYEVDVIITASSIAKGILSVVKGNTKSVSLAFAFIIEAAEQEELPETVLCSCQVHTLDLDLCPTLPPCNLDAAATESE